VIHFKYVCVFVLLFICFFSEAYASKKILVLTDDGGGGHMAASQAIQSAIGSEYEIKHYKLLEKMPLHPKYNEYQKKESFLRLWFLTRLQYFAEILVDALPIRSGLIQQLDTFRPDLLVSVFPVANSMSFQEAEARHIPMLVLTNNFDNRHFFHFLNNPGPNFKIGLPFDDEDLKTQLASRFNDENYVVTGTPLRPEFALSLEEMGDQVAEVRKELEIQPGDQVITLMMGAQGTGKSILEYSRRILEKIVPKEGQVLHVVAMCGNNENLQAKVKALSDLPAGSSNMIKIHALNLKPGSYMAALLRISNVFITKPGGSSVNEGIASGVYALYHPDGISSTPWERGNMTYAEKKGWGERIKKSQFIRQVEKALTREHFNVEVPGKKFKENLLSVVRQLLKETPSETTH
jgi:UDP-N-acetylglucosamine:LPS N-acetylglucosamine transferase